MSSVSTDKLNDALLAFHGCLLHFDLPTGPDYARRHNRTDVTLGLVNEFETAACVRLRWQNVTGLRLEHPYHWFRVDELRVDSQRHRQLEGMHFFVYNTGMDGDPLQFFCERVVAEFDAKVFTVRP